MLGSVRNKAFAVLAVGMLAAAAADAASPEQQAIAGSAKADKLEQCVQPTDFMRRNHMELVLHQRTITVHEGIRKTDDSLAGCVACHVRYDAAARPVPINAPGEFCQECHAEAGVTLDCFQCHTTVPDDSTSPARLGRNPLGQGSPAAAPRSPIASPSPARLAAAVQREGN